MGTQQILMIILSVIVVGASIATGIQMFDTQSENQAILAIQTELLEMAVLAQAWWRTPVMMGGGGKFKTVAAYEAATEKTATLEIMKYINRSAEGWGTITNDTGRYACNAAFGTTFLIYVQADRFGSVETGYTASPVVYFDLAGGAKRIQTFRNYFGGDAVYAWPE